MRLAVTGFVSEQAGSVASANALFLRELLARGHTIDFFSKASFVDPRPAVGSRQGFRFIDTTNTFADQFRQRVQKIPVAGFLAGLLDSSTYNKLLVQEMNRHNEQKPYDACLWLGEFARGRVDGVPSVSYLQGPPGTDARSILHRLDEVSRLAGKTKAARWTILARIRLSRFGLPALGHSDHFIVGSLQASRTLSVQYRVPENRIHTLPYPIDLELFQTGPKAVESAAQEGGPLKVLWLGRIIPRKRLDVFLDGSALAMREGLNVTVTIAGGIGFVPGYEKLIEEFPFPDRLRWEKSVPRQEVPALMRAHDALAQPSDEENFGSSISEAQACGLPTIVGQTNGNADYLCSRDIHLADDRPETFAAALRELARRKAENRWGDPETSRKCAEDHFALGVVTSKLVDILEKVAAR